MHEPRYSRLQRYSGLAGTLERWQQARCAVIGLGGLGGGLCLQLARMGAGTLGEGGLTLIDRDIVEEHNLGHQQLFTTVQAHAGLPKAAAAVETLTAVNPQLRITAEVVELRRDNVAELLKGTELIFDGLDNYYTRLLLNDYAMASGTPYFYAGVVRGELSAKAVVPGVTSCLRCFLPEPPLPGEVPTCAAEGVFPPLLNVANALQLDAANRFLAGTFGPADGAWFSLTVEDWRLKRTSAPPRPGCPACAGQYEFLQGERFAAAQHACSEGRIETELGAGIDLARVAASLEQGGEFAVRQNRFCLSAVREGLSFTLFAGGRLVASGTQDSAELGRFVAEHLGV